MARRNKLLIIISIGLATLFMLAFYLTSRQPKQPEYRGPVGIERGSPSGVGFRGAEKLYDILLSKEYDAVTQELSGYIQKRVASSVVSAEVVAGTTTVNNDGSINFTVKTDNPETSFGVILQRPNPLRIVFVVSQSKYKNNLYPYGQYSD